MSFTLTIPKSDSDDEFWVNLNKATESPKADGRTKVGRRQKEFVRSAKYGLEALYDDVGSGLPVSATANGHVNTDLSGSVTVTLHVLPLTPNA